MAFGDIKEKIEVMPSSHKIKVKAVLELDDLYKECYRWFEHFGYAWREVQYSQIENPNGTKSTEIFWECTREVEDYITFFIELQFQILGYSEVEVKFNGGTKAMQKGTMEFRGGAWIVKKTEAWKNEKGGWKPFGQLMARIYDILIRAKLEDYEDILFDEVHRLYNEIRTYLKAQPQ